MKQSQLPLVSIVIPHRGADGPLRLCIEALRQQTYPASQIEILIVINEPIRRKPIFELESNEKILWEPDYYSYAARNKGIEASKASIIALTDSDTIPDPDWIKEGTQAVLDGPDLVAGAIRLSFSTLPLTPSACYEKLFAFDQEKNANRGRSATANLFVRKSTFDIHGLFDGFAESGEDFVWTRRASSKGSRLGYAANARVSHPARENFSELFKKAGRVASRFKAGSTPLERIVGAYNNYSFRYLISPSREKRASCSFRETILAYSMATLIQAAKLLFFAASAVKSARYHAGEAAPK